MATEITYPSPESTVTGLLLASSQSFGVGLTIALSEIMAKSSMFNALLAQIAILGLGTLLTFLTPNQLRRQAAFNKEIVFKQVPLQEKVQL